MTNAAPSGIKPNIRSIFNNLNLDFFMPVPSIYSVKPVIFSNIYCNYIKFTLRLSIKFK